MEKGGESMKKFYAVAGWNGLAVMSSWEGAQKIQKYIKNASVTSFDTFNEAEHWAILMFSQRVPPEYDIVTELKLDRPVFRKHLRPNFL